MFELWARKEEETYHFICSFSNENCKYTVVDMLDENVYKEAIVIRKSDRNCVLYKEFEKPKVLKK